jgi:hypothetical protein
VSQALAARGIRGGLTDFAVPIQAMTFAVPHDSAQTSISAEAAHLAFGLASKGKVDPWTDENLARTPKRDIRHAAEDGIVGTMEITGDPSQAAIPAQNFSIVHGVGFRLLPK